MESPRRVHKSSFISFISLIVLLGAVFLFSAGFYLREAHNLKNSLKAQESGRVNAFTQILQHHLNSVATDLRELMQGEGLRAYVATGQTADLDAVTRQAVAYSRLKPELDQIRYLNMQGREIMRVNAAGQVVSLDALQDKSDRAYFQEAARLKRGQIYISPLDLNVEGGEIELPYKPVMRLAAPVFDEAGQAHGVYVINYLGGSLISDLERLRPDVEHRLRTLNARGYWLKAANPDHEWGFMFPERENLTLAHTDPKLWARITAEPAGQADLQGRLLSWQRVELGSVIAGGPRSVVTENAFLIVASEITAEEMQTLLAPLRYIFVVLTLLLLAAATIAQRLFRSWRQAMVALRASEQNLSVTFDSLGDAVLATDAEGRVTRMNPIAERLTGWPRAEAMGRPVAEVFNIINEETREPAVIPVDNVLATGEIHGLANHTVIIARDGKEYPIADSAAPIRDERDNILGVVLVFRDVSEEHAAKRALRFSQERYRTLFNSIDEGFCIVQMLFDEDDKPIDYRFLEINPAFVKQSGLENAVGKTVCELAPGTEEHWFELFGSVALTGEPARYQDRSDAMNRDFDGYAFRFGDAENRQVAILFSDVTERREANEKLLAASQAADDANRAKSEFLAMMSHELRTPLNGILGMNDLLLQTNLTDRQRRFVEACSTSGKALLQQINDVLDLSKIEAGKLELDALPCHLESLVYDIVDTFTYTAGKSDLVLKCHMEPAACVKVLVDENRLRQVFLNLMGNAVKFTERGSITITANVIERDGQKITIRFAVTDTGIGIAEDQRHRLFSPFSQLDNSTTRRFGGTGLGLSVSKQLVDLMGGTIDVESKVGEGSTFTFDLPLYLAYEDSDETNRRRTLSGTRVLAVDGIDQDRSQIGECLRAWGCQAKQVADVREALEAVERADELASPFGVVLADCRLAVGDEYVLLARLARHPYLPIIGLGGGDDEASVEYLRQIGVRHILHDPVRPSALYNAISSVLSITDIPGASARDGCDLPAPTDAGLAGHILVAEDNRINQLYVVELLKACGCTCDVATNGRDALEAVKTKHYNMVLMDCQMPEMDGFTAAGEIRRWESEQQPSRRIAIVALTANALKGDRDRCIAAGMDDYLSKPIAADKLRDTLTRYMRSDSSTAAEETSAD